MLVAWPLKLVKKINIFNSINLEEKGDLSLSRVIDIWLFGILLALILLYQVQLLTSWMPRVFRLREILYAYLYLRMLMFYRPRLNYNFLFLYAFLAHSAFVGLHTYYVYGIDMSIQGFMRFINVALLAPLAATFFTNIKQVKLFFSLWLGVFLLGSGTAIYQFLGGELSWLVQDYVVVRGGLVRFKTLLGEPNVGGMACVIAYIYTVMNVRSWFWKIVVISASLTLLVLSLSKAALGGFVLATLILIIYKREFFTKKTLKKALIVGIIVLVLGLSLMGISPGLRQGFVGYSTAMFGNFFSIGSEANAGNNVFLDLSDRVLGRTISGIELTKMRSDIFLQHLLVGNSYGMTGSAARELLEPSNVFMPHNSYLEIFLVGGLFMFVFFLCILYTTFTKLYFVSFENKYYQALIACLFILAVYMLSYSNIYEPITGTFFWVTVGITANRRLTMSPAEFK